MSHVATHDKLVLCLHTLSNLILLSSSWYVSKNSTFLVFILSKNSHWWLASTLTPNFLNPWLKMSCFKMVRQWWTGCFYKWCMRCHVIKSLPLDKGSVFYIYCTSRFIHTAGVQEGGSLLEARCLLVCSGGRMHRWRWWCDEASNPPLNQEQRLERVWDEIWSYRVIL